MKLDAEELRSLYRAFITTLGGSREEADCFAHMFVIADLRGMDWQGLKSLHKHVIFPVREGIIRLGGATELIREGPSSAVLDAHGGLGQVVCKAAMQLAIEKAEAGGTACIAIRNCGDTGLLAGYTMMAVEHGCIGVMFNNTNPYVVPWGGNEPILGIDPFSVAIPAGEERPVLLDMSITKAQPYHDTPVGWVPPFPSPPLQLFETVREYALSAVVELACGALSGMPIGRDKIKRGESGAVCAAIHIPHFTDIQEFRQRVDSYIRQVKSTRPSDESTEVLMPGERGFREQDHRLQDGIPVSQEVWDAVIDIATELGVDWRGALARAG